MADLFGIDIAKTVSDSIAAAGGVRPGTLTHISPGTRGANPTGGTAPTETSHTFQGFVDQRDVRRTGEVATNNMSVVSMLGASVLPLVVPVVNDRVVIDGVTYTLVELLGLDPASALYEFAADA